MMPIMLTRVSLADRAKSMGGVGKIHFGEQPVADSTFCCLCSTNLMMDYNLARKGFDPVKVISKGGKYPVKDKTVSVWKRILGV